MKLIFFTLIIFLISCSNNDVGNINNETAEVEIKINQSIDDTDSVVHYVLSLIHI